MANPKTPLRYPGGKQRIWRFVAEVIRENNLEGGHYVEPYAGGAGVAMELLLNDVVSYVHLNDACPAIYAFWHSIKNYPDEMCRRIRTASLTVKEWRKQKEIYHNPKEHDKIDAGFALFYLNRCNRSGILTGGLIGGLKQDGPWKMDARFPRNKLIERIERIALKRKYIKIRNWDAEKFITKYIPRLPKQTLTYCDPPYFKKAERLYANYYTESDHARLADTVQGKMTSNWLVSYDNAPEILKRYQKRRSFTYLLQYNAANTYKGSELFVFSDGLIMPTQSEVLSINDALCNVT